MPGCKQCVNLKIQVQWSETDVYKIAKVLNRCSEAKRGKHLEQRNRDVLFLHEAECGSTPIGGIDESA